MSFVAPEADPTWILHEDEDLLVVSKPSGVPSQAADPEHPDDLPTRLARFLAARDGSAPSLGIHQRLDKDTSGVIVFSKSARAKREVQKQIEAHAVGKEYVAVVVGYRGGERTLVHHLAPPVDGRVSVVPAGDPRGKRAITHVRPVESRGPRTLLSLRIETGRTHQIRAQLAAIGASVAGDATYGEVPAPRLLLHAHAITLVHPGTGAEVTYRAKVPAVFRRFLEEGGLVRLDDEKAVRDALRRARDARWGLSRARSDDRAIDAFRLVHAEGDGVPGITVDVYGDHAVLHLYGDEAVANEARLLDAVLELGFDGVYVKRRPRQANVVADTRREDLAPPRAVRGTSAPDEIVVREHGVPYFVRLGDGLSTGIFVDQRDNRRRVIGLARGRRVLNLFAYTCAFSCAAARGGASAVTSIDVAAPALAWGERNVALGESGVEHRVVRADVFEALADLAVRGERFELVVCDPPTYSTTRAGRWTSGRDWIRLTEQVLAVTAPGGSALLTSNDHRMDEARFARLVREGARAAGRAVRHRTYRPPTDHPTPVGGVPHLKTLVLDT